MASNPDLVERLGASLSDRYRIETEIGAGGMARVYLARDRKHDRQVVIKVLEPELAGHLGSERFLREIETVSRLTHPHILPLFDSGEADGLLFFVMPYVRGESLRSRLDKEGQLPVDVAVSMTREIAGALAYAHGEGVVHRDVKPANIMLEAGHAVLADFGVAHAVAEARENRLTATGTSLGTPDYMSPEQATGEQTLDGRSDQYALACVLYEMLAGRPPFAAPRAESVIRQHLTVKPSPLTEIRPTVPADLEAVVDRAMQKNPADRFPTTGEFEGALASAAGRLSASLSKDGSPAGSGKHDPHSSPRRLGKSVGIAGTAILLLLFLFLGRRIVPTERSGLGEGGDHRVVVLPFDNQTGDPELDPMGRWVAEWITEALARTGEVQVIPNMMVQESVTRIRGAGGPPDRRVSPRRVAGATGASIAVSGSYYLRGGEVEFHAEVVDVASGRPLGAVSPVRGSAEDPSGAVASVESEVLGVLATRIRPGTAWEVPPSVQPPSYEAFQAYARGGDLWLQARYADAAEWYLRAYEADTTFLRSLLAAAAAYENAGNLPVFDSLLQVLLPRREELAPYDQFRLDYGAAGRRGDRAAQLRAARAGVALVPSGSLRLALVLMLEGDNRPREALEHLTAIWSDLQAIGGDWYPIWDGYTTLLHMLGNHQDELAIAREGTDRYPTSLHLLAYEGRALAALGRLEALDRVAERILVAPDQPDTNVGLALEELAEELRAHGHESRAEEVAQEALDWLDGQPAEFSSTLAARKLRGRLLYRMGRWEEAEAAFENLRPDHPADPSLLGTLGTLAARRGDSATAARFSSHLQALDLPRPGGQPTLWQARIDAVLGRQEEATALLRQAFGEGVAFGIWVHRDLDLESLRDYPPYVELVEPKG